MRDIDEYTKAALEAKNSGMCHVVKYQREAKSYGITEIKYDLIPGKYLHLLSIPTFGAFTVVCGVTTLLQYVFAPPETRYFDTASGELLGRSKNEAARCANQKGDDFFKKGKFSEAQECFEKAYQTCATDDPKEKIYKRPVA